MADSGTSTTTKRKCRVCHWNLWALVGPVVVLILWQAAHSFQAVDPSLLPSPRATLASFVRQFSTGAVLPDLTATVLRMLIGYLLASVVGISLGLLMGSSRAVYESTVTVTDFFRSIPVTSLYPVFVLTLGVSHVSKIGMVFFASVLVVALHSAYGVHRAKPCCSVGH
jgi:NitT/TauT family transport system permease protein